MDPKSKITRLSALDEKALREQVLVPLLARMGLQGVTIYHGSRERGKDIVCFQTDLLGRREYLAVVAKAVDLNGSVYSSDSLKEVLFQIEQCFDTPYQDLFGKTEVTMDRVWVVSSRSIIAGSADSVYSRLAKTNLSKLVAFIPQENLINLIDVYYVSYWDESLEPADILKEQKHRLVAFLKRLLLAYGDVDEAEIHTIINQVLSSRSYPRISTKPDRTLSRISSYNIEIDSISPVYAHDFYSTNCGLIRKAFFKAKEDLYRSMFDVDRIIEAYEKVIEKTDPREFVDAFREELYDCYPFYRASWGKAADVMRDIMSLENGLSEVDELRDNLEGVGRLELAMSIVDSVKELKEEVNELLPHIDEDPFVLSWKMEPEGVRLLSQREGSDNNDSFSTEHHKEVEYYSPYHGRKPYIRPITADDILEEVQYKIRKYLERTILHREWFYRDSP